MLDDAQPTTAGSCPSTECAVQPISPMTLRRANAQPDSSYSALVSSEHIETRPGMLGDTLPTAAGSCPSTECAVQPISPLILRRVNAQPDSSYSALVSSERIETRPGMLGDTLPTAGGS